MLVGTCTISNKSSLITLSSGVMLLQTGNTSKRYISGPLVSTGVLSLGQPGQVMLNVSTLSYDL